MKLALCGPGRSGKDEAAIWFNDHTSLSYSGFSTSAVIAPYAAKRLGLSVEAAFARRYDDRMLWYEIGNSLRLEDPAFLARRALAKSDIAVGIRDRGEIEAALSERLVDLAIWIDRDVPVDPTLMYGPEVCHIIVQNRGTMFGFHSKLHRLAECLGILKSQVEVVA